MIIVLKIIKINKIIVLLVAKIVLIIKVYVPLNLKL